MGGIHCISIKEEAMSEVIVCSISTFFSLFLLYFAQGFPKSVKPNVPSASFFPTLIAIVLLGLSIYNLVVCLIQRKKAKEAGEKKEKIVKRKVLQIVEILLMLFLYAFLWKFHIGHFLLNSILVFTPVCLLMGDETVWWKSTIFSVCLVVFIYLLFTFLLKVRLW